MAKAKQVVTERKSEFISVPAAAEWLSVSQPTIWRFLTKKRLRRYKVGARTLVSFEDVQKLVEAK